MLVNLLGNAVKFTDAGGVTFKVKVVESVAVDLTAMASPAAGIAQTDINIKSGSIGIINITHSFRHGTAHRCQLKVKPSQRLLLDD